MQLRIQGIYDTLEEYNNTQYDNNEIAESITKL